MQEENIKETNILLGILLAILIGINSLAILFIIGVSKVDAASPDYWYDNFKTPLYVEYWGWTSNTNHSTIATKKDTWYVQGTSESLDLRNIVVNNNAMTLDTLGLTFKITTDETMKSNYIYSWQIAVCSNNSMDSISYYSVSNQSDRNSNYSYGTKINVSSVPSYTNWTSCKIISGLVEDTEGSNNLYVRIKPSSTISNEYLYILGYNLQPIGLYDQWIYQTLSSMVATQNTTIQGYLNTQTNALTTIMNNNTQSTNNTIEQTSQQQIESQQVCNDIDKNYIELENKALFSGGEPVSVNDWGITRYINIQKATITKKVQHTGNTYLWFYDVNKNRISSSGIEQQTIPAGQEITIPSGAVYVRFTIQKSANKPQYSICQNGNQAAYGQQQEINNQDLSEQDKQNADNTGVENYEDAEQDLIDQMNMNVFDDVDIDLDINSNNWVWNTMTSLITSNQAIMTMFISILSIGVIKLVLVR